MGSGMLIPAFNCGHWVNLYVHDEPAILRLLDAQRDGRVSSAC